MNSFAAGTLVALSTVAGAAPIEGLEVGDRVATIAATSETAVDDTWRVAELELDIGRRVTLLRPPAWFAAHELTVGARTTVAFSLGSEALITGVVRDLRPFRGPADGPGRVVLATLEGVADELYSLTFEGIKARLQATAEHPLYSLDRGKWLGVEELTVGERLQTAEGAVTIAALERERGAHRVLNLEVEGEHEYLVGDAEVRAHNAGCGPRNRDIGPSGKPKRHQVRYNTKKRMREAGSGSNRSKSSRRRGEPRRKRGVIDRHANSPTPSGGKWGGIRTAAEMASQRSITCFVKEVQLLSMSSRKSERGSGLDPSQQIATGLKLDPTIWQVSVDYSKGVLTKGRGVVVCVEHIGRGERLRLHGTAKSKAELRRKALELARLLVARLS